jgi:hypothetical protein
VESWLIESGISAVRISLASNKGWLAFVATVKEVEELLYTQYFQYQDVHTGQISNACEQYVESPSRFV